MPAPADQPWWKSAVIYQIYPRSFCDASGDGIGDLEGIRRHLDHIAELGVDTLWLSPFFPSPMKDFGYDVADYCNVDPLFGTLADFDRLLAEAHARGLRVLIDWVPNHSSDQHPWFQEARRSRSSPKRDWYVWRDGTPEQPPNNWRAAFIDGPAWTWDESTGQWYLHLFLAEQPDLNWGNPEVEQAMHETLRFWLDRGVDGFRMDVIHCIGKDPALSDVPDELVGLPSSALNDDPRTHTLLRRIRGVLEAYPGERMMLGEVFLLETGRVATYYGAGDELHLAFNFPPLFAGWDAATWRAQIEQVNTHIEARGAWPTWVLSNHDNKRHRTRYGSDGRARAAAVLLLGLRGTPHLYAGEELGLEDAEIPASRRVDPGGRDGCRAPIPWSGNGNHGWAGSTPWLPWPPDRASQNVEAETADPERMLHLNRRLLHARRDSPALRLGSQKLLDTPDGVLAFRRDLGDEHWIVAINFMAEERTLALEGAWRVHVATERGLEDQAFDKQLGPDGAVLLRRGL